MVGYSHDSASPSWLGSEYETCASVIEKSFEHGSKSIRPPNVSRTDARMLGGVFQLLVKVIDVLPAVICSVQRLHSRGGY